MNNQSQTDNRSELRKVQEDCEWLVSIGAMTKEQAIAKIFDKAISMLQALKMPEPVVIDDYAKKNYEYMAREAN